MKSLLTILTTAAMALSAFAQDATIKTVPVYSYAGVPASGTSEVDTITIGGTTTGGTFTITVASGRTTPAISWSATNATLISNIDTALEGLNVIGTGGVTTAALSLTSGTGTITTTFTGKMAKTDAAALSVTSSLTGTVPTVAISTTTAGVEATFRNAPAGTLVVDTLTPDLYQNTSATIYSPTWTLLPRVAGKAGIGQIVVSATSADVYLTGSSGLRISGTTVAAF